MDVGFPVELILDELTVFDARAKVMAQVTIVYDLQQALVKNKVRAYLPDGSVRATEFRLQSSVAALVGLVSPEQPEAKLEVKLSDTETVDAHLRLDPHDPDRFFVRIGDSVWGHGRRVRSEGADLALLIALLLGSGINVETNDDGQTEIEIEFGDIADFYDAPEGYDVSLEIEAVLDLGFIRIEFELHIGTGGGSH